jgi:hypothetical protein
MAFVDDLEIPTFVAPHDHHPDLRARPIGASSLLAVADHAVGCPVHYVQAVLVKIVETISRINHDDENQGGDIQLDIGEPQKNLLLIIPVSRQRIAPRACVLESGRVCWQPFWLLERVSG